MVADEQFCPSCGTWIDPLQAEQPEFEEFALGEPDDEPAPPGPVRVPRQEVQCPSCGSSNPVTNRHCEECGARLFQGQLPVAPRPAVQTTAGVRAAMLIAVVLGVVIVAVVLANVFGGNTPAASTLASGSTTTTTALLPPAPVVPLSVDCTVEGLAGFPCDNLIDGEGLEYQFNWEELDPGTEVDITFTFAEPTEIAGLIFVNLEDEDRFAQNYRVADASIDDGTALAIPVTVPNTPGSNSIEYVSMRTNKLIITITGVHSAEERGGQVFSELAIEEIQILGRPARVNAPTDTTTPEETTTTG